MEAAVLARAREMTVASGTEETLLQMLCKESLRRWTARLLPEADCREALICAAALSAAAALAVSRGADAAESFRAGDVSVTARGGAERMANAEALRAEAERLMAPYVAADDFFFRGVPG